MTRLRRKQGTFVNPISDAIEDDFGDSVAGDGIHLVAQD